MADLDDGQNERVRNKMREWMRVNEASQAQLARSLGISGASLGRILSTGGGASHMTAHRFARLAGVSFDELVGPAGSPTSALIITTDVLPDERTAWLLHFEIGMTAARLDGASAVDVELVRQEVGDVGGLRWDEIRSRVMAKRAVREALETPARARSTELEIQRAMAAIKRDGDRLVAEYSAPPRGVVPKRAKPVTTKRR